MGDKSAYRLIFHCDCNNFFASCECLERPELKDVPMAVAGDPKDRVGVVVAKNELAKRFGVKTTDTVWAARKKCPQIVFVPPQHSLYRKMSEQVNALYREYTEYVEPASIDESYLDMTGAPEFYGFAPRQLADELRRRVRGELGLTISVGVSYNKIFAKMGSDYKKPDATTEITEENYRDIIWPLPVGDLMFVGHAANAALKAYGINTIGELARCDRAELTGMLGKLGEQLWIYANGLDNEPVRLFGDEPEVKSVSRGMTFRRDLVTEEEVHDGLAVLVDEVATALRRQGLKGAVIEVKIKSPDLSTISRQVTLERSTYLQHEILQVAEQLVKSHWRIGQNAPIRALTVGVGRLTPENEVVEQLSLFDMGFAEQGTAANRDRREKIEAAVDMLRQKHGSKAITLGFMKNEDIGIKR